MYLHIGQGVVVPTASIVGVFDLDNTTVSRETRKFLKKAEEGGHIVNVFDDLPKSFVVCRADNESTIYLSQLSPQTLGGRGNKFYAGNFR